MYITKIQQIPDIYAGELLCIFLRTVTALKTELDSD